MPRSSESTELLFVFLEKTFRCKHGLRPNFYTQENEVRNKPAHGEANRLGLEALLPEHSYNDNI